MGQVLGTTKYHLWESNPHRGDNLLLDVKRANRHSIEDLCANAMRFNLMITTL